MKGTSPNSGSFLFRFFFKKKSKSKKPPRDYNTLVQEFMQKMVSG